MQEVKNLIMANDPMDLETIREQIKTEMDAEISKSTLSRALKHIGSFWNPPGPQLWQSNTNKLV